MSCNKTLLAICDYKKGDLYESFDITFNNDFDFTLTSAKFEIIKNGAVILNWTATIGAPDSDGKVPMYFEKPTGFDALEKGLYKLQLAVFDGIKRITIPARDFRVL